MKGILLSTAALLLMFSCATPKYSYHFSTHKNYVKNQDTKSDLSKEITSAEVAITEVEVSSTPDQSVMTANSTNESVVLAEVNPLKEKANLLKEKYSNANFSDPTVIKEVKSDVKELKKDVKKYLKESKKKDSVTAASQLDKNLRFALIFGLAALLASIFVWQLGAILWIVAIVFLILWLLEQ